MADEYLTAALYGMKRFNEGASKKVKELMGMEKLVELLNEYEEKYRDFHFVGDWNEGREFTEFEVAFIISKKFGFIKWLVENEKIEENSDLITLASELGCAFSSDVLLMYLAIQDEPIGFLISILK